MKDQENTYKSSKTFFVLCASMLLLCPFANADMITLVNTDGVLSVETIGTRAANSPLVIHSDGFIGYNLDGPGPNITYQSISCLAPITGCTAVTLSDTGVNFGDPTGADDFTNILIFFHPHAGLDNHAISEMTFMAGPFPPFHCATSPVCVMAQNNVVYPVVDLLYTNGEVDRLNFQWVVTPEPGNLVLVGTIAILAAIKLSRRRFADYRSFTGHMRSKTNSSFLASR
jgi:hypothetical protein